MPDANNIGIFLTPNISLDPTIALAGSQSQRFDAGAQQQGTLNQQAFGVEYQIPFAIRYDTPIVVSDLANSIGVPDLVGNGTGAGAGSNTNVGPPGPPGLPGAGTPSGSDTEVQFNSSGSFAGDSGLVYVVATGVLGVVTIQNVRDDTVAPNTGDLTLQSTQGTKIRISTDNDGANATGDLSIFTGASSASSSGAISIRTGDGTGTTNTGKIIIATGNVTVPSSGNGSIDIFSQKNMNIEAAGTSANLFLFATGSTTVSANGTTSIVSNAGLTSVSSFTGTTITTATQAAVTADVTVSTGAVSSGAHRSGAITIITGATPNSSFSGDLTLRTPLGTATTAGTITIDYGTGEALITLSKDQFTSLNGQITLDANTIVSIEPYRGSTVGNILMIFKGTSALGANSAGTVFIGEVQTAPTGNPTSGGQLYVSSGALIYRGSGGTVTTIAPA